MRNEAFRRESFRFDARRAVAPPDDASCGHAFGHAPARQRPWGAASLRCGAIAASLMLLAGCTAAPVREDIARVGASVALAGAGAPQLPAADAPSLDAAAVATPLTAETAVQAALRNNPRVRAALARLDAAQAERVQAGLLRNPVASLMVLRPRGGGRYELDYSLMQSLFDLFSRTRRVAAAGAAQRQVEAEVVMTLAALAQDTQAAYYEAWVTQARLRVKREQLALDEQVLALLDRQARSGAVAADASLEQRAAASMRAHEVSDAEAASVRARADFARWLGLPSARALILPEDPPAIPLAAADEPVLRALALAHRPDLREADARVEQARAEAALETGALRTTDPSAGPAGMRESDGMSLAGLEIEVMLPIFDDGRARRALADAQVVQARFTAEAVRREAPLDVERAVATLAAAQLAVGHAAHHLRQQQQLERLARRTYEQGGSDLPRYRQAGQARLAATLDKLDAQAALWSAAVALARATGVAAGAPTS